MQGRGHPPMDNAVSRTQTQIVKQKNLEVKKQMLYSTYSNIINILEEIESRQLQQSGQVPLPRSSTEWFDHSNKSIETLDQVAKAQLMVLESMLKTAENQMKGPLKADIFNKTRNWMGAREQRKLAIDTVDKYAYMILEIIAYGKTSHDPALISTRTIDCKPTDEDTNCLIRGMYEAERRGKSFEDNPSKEAACREIRSGDVKIVQITSGSKLIWGLDNIGMIHTIEIRGSNSKEWNSMGNPAILFKEIKTDIYDNGVFAVGIDGILYARTGIKHETSTGDHWMVFAPTASFKFVHVATCSGYMLLQNTAYEFLYYRNKELHKLQSSEKSGEIEQFCCGKYHFWGVDHLDNVYTGTFLKGWRPLTKFKNSTGPHVDTCDDGVQVWINVGTRKGNQLYISKFDANNLKVTQPVEVALNGRSIRGLIRHNEYFVVIDDNCRIWACKDLSSNEWYQFPELKKSNEDEMCLLHFSSNGHCTWAVDSLGNICVHQDSKDKMIKWKTVPTGMQKTFTFSQVFASSYNNCVWALDRAGKPYCRLGISPKNVEGISWKSIDLPGPLALQHLSMTPNGVMALDQNHGVWSRSISEAYPVGGAWEKQSSINNDILCDQRMEKIQTVLTLDDNSSMM